LFRIEPFLTAVLAEFRLTQHCSLDNNGELSFTRPLQLAIWYINEHCHSRIGFVTPVQRHRGDDKALLAQRKTVYEKSWQRNPLRWSGEVGNWQYIKEVSLNPGKPVSAEAKAA
jgi:hypothetical protein